MRRGEARVEAGRNANCLSNFTVDRAALLLLYYTKLDQVINSV